MYDKNYLETLEHGEDRLTYLKKCIAEADNEKDIHNMLWLRHDYIQESVFHDDAFKAIVMFPEFMKLFDENPGEMPPRAFMFPFKWILEDCEEYYQVSLEQIDSYFERFKEYIKKFGYTMRTYYYKKYQVYQDIDREVALKAFDEFEKYERTEMSDCIACEGNTKARKEMFYGSEKKAVEMLNDMLERNLRCSEVPQVTFSYFADQFAKHGMYDEAEHYAELALPMIKGDEVNYMVQVGEMISLKTQTDLNTAFELFMRCAGKFSRLKNHAYRFSFAKAAYRFFAKLAELGEEEIPMRLSSDFEFFNADGKYNVADLRDKFYAIAKDIGEKFDKRNGTNYYAEELAFVYPDSPAQKPELPVHGSFAPESPVIGLLLKSPEEIPIGDPDNFAQLLTEKCGITEIGFGMDEETHHIFISGKGADGSKVRYSLRLHDAPDIEQFRQVHWLPEGALDDIGEYTQMAVVTSMIPDSDRFAELRKLLKFAAAIDRGSAPIFYDLINMRFLSKKWLALEASGDTDPFVSYYTRTWLYRSAFDEERIDIMTSGMVIFGSRDLLVPAVKEEDVEFVTTILNNLVNAAAVSPLTDEGVTMNSGIVYDDKSFARFTWQPITMPSDGDSDEEQQVYAEPILYLTAADQMNGKGYKLDEIPEAEREKLSPRTHNSFTRTEEAKCCERFPAVLDYFRTHDCGVIIGAYYPCQDEDLDEDDCWFHAELIENLSKGKVLDRSPALEDALHEGDIVDIDPEKVFFERIDLDSGEDSYFVDEFYILFD